MSFPNLRHCITDKEGNSWCWNEDKQSICKVVIQDIKSTRDVPDEVIRKLFEERTQNVMRVKS